MSSSHHNRCPNCLLRLDLCLCSLIPRIETKTRLIIAMHIAENNKPSNTARLLKLSLLNSEIKYQGRIHEPLDVASMISPGRKSVLLFPEAPTNIAELANEREPITLIVPDGTWQQAKRIAATIASSLPIRRVSIPPEVQSAYQLRHADRAGRLSTLEAVARALEPLEGSSVRFELEKIFYEMVRRTLIARNGRKRAAN